MEKARAQFAERGWQLVVIGRMVPAGRIPVLLARGRAELPVAAAGPTAAGACLLWSAVYAALGVVSGGLFDHPIVATVIATVLVLVVTAVSALVARQRERRRAVQDVS